MKYKVVDLKVETHDDYFSVTYWTNVRDDHEKASFSIDKRVADQLAVHTEPYKKLQDQIKLLEHKLKVVIENGLGPEDLKLPDV